MKNKKELTDAEKDFSKWLESFINGYGHQWGSGFYVKLHSGEVFYIGTNEYERWYNRKLEEYKQIYKF